MKDFNLDDTIAAIATPIGESGIGIVRISGKDALKVADKIFVSRNGGKPSSFKTYTVHYGWIASRSPGPRVRGSKFKNPRTQEPKNPRTEIIDEVILTIMRAPKSYTKEDVVEINCHGGITALRSVLDLVLENGCRVARPGEFTKRAFLNGRIDLTQAEAVLDIIRSKTNSGLKVGIEQLKGALSVEINKIRKILLDILSVLEANIDFPEEEAGRADLQGILKKLSTINRQLIAMIDASKYGRIIREGIRAVICGRPNVGKSSLLNALLKQERSIVTHIPGTTRDAIEEIIDIKGIPVRIVDTAGILEPRDLIERKAVARSKQYLDSADLAILLFEGNKKITREDKTLMERLKKKTCIAVINKIDLKQAIERDKISKIFKYLVDISAKRLKNIDLLEGAIVNLIFNGKVASPESGLVCNLRHIEAVKEAQKLIAKALDSLDNNLSLEFIAQDLKEALSGIDSLLGKRYQEDLLDRIFRDFCIGK